jgi:hypothetical protein
MVPGDGTEALQRCGEYTFKQGELRGIVGEERRGKATDGCPLTQQAITHVPTGMTLWFILYLVSYNNIALTLIVISSGPDIPGCWA